MVDLGQKGWKRFHLFYWNKVKVVNRNKEIEKDIKRSKLSFLARLFFEKKF